MDQCTFDGLSRRVSAAATRRGALRAVVAVGIGALLPGAASASQTVKGCRVPGQGCDRDVQCCSGQCRDGRCKCLERGKSCLVSVSPQLPPLPNKAICCSSKCSRGKNKCR